MASKKIKQQKIPPSTLHETALTELRQERLLVQWHISDNAKIATIQNELIAVISEQIKGIEALIADLHAGVRGVAQRSKIASLSDADVLNLVDAIFNVQPIALDAPTHTRLATLVNKRYLYTQIKTLQSTVAGPSTPPTLHELLWPLRNVEFQQMIRNLEYKNYVEITSTSTWQKLVIDTFQYVDYKHTQTLHLIGHGIAKIIAKQIQIERVMLKSEDLRPLYVDINNLFLGFTKDVLGPISTQIKEAAMQGNSALVEGTKLALDVLYSKIDAIANFSSNNFGKAYKAFMVDIKQVQAIGVNSNAAAPPPPAQRPKVGARIEGIYLGLKLCTGYNTELLPKRMEFEAQLLYRYMEKIGRSHTDYSIFRGYLKRTFDKKLIPHTAKDLIQVQALADYEGVQIDL
jgi:hypothetical protein